MPLQAHCTACNHRYQVADQLAGKTIRCSKCGAAVALPRAAEKMPPTVEPVAPPGRTATPAKGGAREAIRVTPVVAPVPPRQRRHEDDEEPRPRRQKRRRRDEEDDEPERSGSMGLVIGLIAGGAGLLVLLGVAATILVFSSSATPELVNGPVAQNPNPPPLPPLAPGGNNPVAFQPHPGPPILPQNNPPLRQPEQEQPPRVVQWQVAPDPGPDLNKAPANPSATVALVGNPQVVFPSTPSPVVGIRHGSFRKEAWQIFDLQKSQPLATLAKPDMRDEVLSPDGKYLAGKGRLQLNQTDIHVIDTSKGGPACTIALDTKAAAFRLIDFLPDDHLLTYKTRGLTGYFEVFRIADGQAVKTFTVEGLLDPDHHFAFSPGRKYLAVAHKSQIDIFQPLTGELAGQIQLPFAQGSFKALAFSPDGQEFACLLEKFGSSARLLSWKVQGGKLGVDHKFAKSITELTKGFGYQGRIMEWLPDGSGWLFYGQTWIDYASGAPVYSLPVPPGRNWPRRLIGKEHLATVTGTGQQQALVLAPLPTEEITQKIQEARNGGGKAPDTLPAPKTADLALAKTLPAPNGAVAWQVQADPAPAVPAANAFIPVRSKPADVLQIAFARTEAAIVSKAAPNALSISKNIQADRYELNTGKHLGTCNLYSAAVPENRFGSPAQLTVRAELSPDGTRLAVSKSAGEPRLDIWDLTEGKHLVGWMPCAGGKVEWFAFVAEDRLLTSDGSGKIILWKVPDCQAVYVAQGYRGRAQLSPGRQYLAACSGTGIDLLDSATGERRGTLAALNEPVTEMKAAAFSRDGKEFAALVPASNGVTTARWNLGDGSLRDSIQGHLGCTRLAILGPKFTLHDNTLFDWNLKGPLWNYLTAGQSQGGGIGPDGRYWFVASQQNNHFLTAQTLPEHQALQLAQRIAGGQLQLAIKPGMPVQVNISGSERFRTAVQQTLAANLQARGYRVGPGGLTLTITATEGPTGRQFDYDIFKFGGAGLPGRGRQTIRVVEQKIDCRFVVTDAAGVTLTSSQAAFATPRSLRFQGEDYQSQLNEAMWNSAISWGRSVGLPTNLYQIDGRVQSLPMSSTLTMGR